jgi:hypothetical protein
MKKVIAFTICISVICVVTYTKLSQNGADMTKPSIDVDSRAECLLIQRNYWSVVRSHHGVNGLNYGDPIDTDELMAKYFPSDYKVSCPLDGIYWWSSVIPPHGDAPISCSHPDHQPDDTSSW